MITIKSNPNNIATKVLKCAPLNAMAAARLCAKGVLSVAHMMFTQSAEACVCPEDMACKVGGVGSE